MYPLPARARVNSVMQVRCQADGLSTMAAIRILAQNGPQEMVKSLYAGLGSATAFSVGA